MTIVSEVGVDSNQGWDDFKAKLDPITRKGLEYCNVTDPCIVQPIHDEFEGKLSNARVEHLLVTGRPSISAPYTKNIHLSIPNANVEYTAAVVVVGKYSRGAGDSFALPTHKPIMILRDPPGGMSTASYENVKTTIKVDTSSTSSSISNSFGFGVRMDYDVEVSACLGGLVSSLCKETISGGVKTNIIDFEELLGGMIILNDKSKSNEFSTTWSYETSDDPWTAGRLSDVFVVPNLNVLYERVKIVRWDNATCR